MSDFFPEWMPLWLQVFLVVTAVVYGLFFLMIPFAVFGLKGRLAEIELQQHEIQADLRSVSMHLVALQAQKSSSVVRDVPAPDAQVPVSSGGVTVEEVRFAPPPPPRAEEPPAMPAILPAIRAPRVSDAYEPRRGAPPVPHMTAAPTARGARSMPWHTQKSPVESEHERAPDANREPHRIDFSQDRPDYADQRRQAAERTEPMLNWPPTRSGS